jgi:hypothetical protein
MITQEELDNIQMYAADKYGGIENHEAWLNAIRVFVDTYIQGGKFVIYNANNQPIAHFSLLDDAVGYIEERKPNNGLYRIECEILK